MPLPTSGTLTLNQIKTEFGATGTRGLTEFYRGGAFVANTSANAGIPTSGQIDILDFYGASNATVTLANTYFVGNITSTPDASIVSISFESDGDIITNGSLGVVDEGDWVNPKSAAPGSYEIRATLNSGDGPVGTVGSWLALTSTRTWSLTKPGFVAGSRECELTIEIRLGTAVLDSTIVTLRAEVFDGGGGF